MEEATRSAAESPRQAPILPTKLIVPRTRECFVARPRLVERLDEALRGPLTLVSAPAGFGKTTLFAGLRETHPWREASFAWLSLDPEDDELVRFWDCVLAALRVVRAGVGRETAARLRDSSPAVALAGLVDDLVAVDEPLVLVLDDYHLIASALVHDSLAYFVEHLPPSLHLAVLTRRDPPWPLSRWRARGRVAEVRAVDLQFRVAEAEALLCDSMRLSVAADVVSALVDRTEGWAVGLQMAGLSLRGRDDAAEFVRSFSGTNRFILDFLLDEVLSREDPTVQRYLLETSVLTRLCAPLCDSVTGRREGQAMLERLERSNLFVVCLDDDRRWYRYHHLFAELLRARLDESDPSLAPVLLSRAAEWFESQDLAGEAIACAFAARDHDHAARLLENSFVRLVAGGDVGFTHRLDELPD